MELKDTAVMMTSADYKERFRAEFEQTRIRHQKLLDMIEKYKAGTLDFVPACPVELLERQSTCTTILRYWRSVLQSRESTFTSIARRVST